MSLESNFSVFADYNHEARDSGVDAILAYIDNLDDSSKQEIFLNLPYKNFYDAVIYIPFSNHAVAKATDVSREGLKDLVRMYLEHNKTSLKPGEIIQLKKVINKYLSDTEEDGDEGNEEEDMLHLN